MKDNNIFQELKVAKKEFNVACAKKRDIDIAMKREIEETVAPIKDKYVPLLEQAEKEMTKTNGRVWDLAGTYHDCGSFLIRDIVDIVAMLLTYIEGEEYIWYENLKINQSSIIIKAEVSKHLDDVNDDILNQLYKNGDLVMLDYGFASMVDFYNYYGEPNYQFGPFNYLREFVNRLIQYRIDNGLKMARDVSREQLYSFMVNFIAAHPELVQKNADKRDQLIYKQREDKEFRPDLVELENKLFVLEFANSHKNGLKEQI